MDELQILYSQVFGLFLLKTLTSVSCKSRVFILEEIFNEVLQQFFFPPHLLCTEVMEFFVTYSTTLGLGRASLVFTV